MNKTNIFLITLGLIMFSVFSYAAKQGVQLKDLGMDGEARMYDLLCPSGKNITIFQPVGPIAVDNLTEADIETVPEDIEIIDLKEVSGTDFELESKPRVCTATGGGELDCEQYKDLDTAAEAVCEKLG